MPECDFIARFLEQQTPNTRRAYEFRIREFINFLHEFHITIEQCTKRTIIDYKSTLYSLKPSTQKAYITPIKSLFRWLSDNEYINTTAHLANIRIKIREENPHKRYLSPDEIHLLFTGCADDIDRFIMTWLYYGGLRVSELCNIQMRDIQPGQGECRVAIDGKGGKNRIIGLPITCMRTAESISHGPGYLLVGRDDLGRPCAPSTIFRRIRRIADRAGIKRPISPHWLRHAHISHALDNNAPPATVRDSVGHASLATTSKYAHPRPGDSSSAYLGGYHGSTTQTPDHGPTGDAADIPITDPGVSGHPNS